MRLSSLLLASLLVACGDDAGTSSSGGGGQGGAGGAPPASSAEVHLGEIVDANGEGSVTVVVAPGGTVTVHLDGAARVLEADVSGADAATFSAGETPVGVPGEDYGNGVWLRPRPVASSVVTLTTTGDAPARITLFARGAPVPPARIERSLFWTEAAIVDDASVVGLARALAPASADGHGGRLLDAWLHRFASTQHSERAGPAQLADELLATYGSDPTTWDLDAMPFRVTGVHNRLDLGPRSGGCGELRISLASTHSLYAPFHALFLYAQPPREDDVGPDGVAHCLGTARRWGRLSALDGAAFADAARALLDEALVPERFVIAETVELTVSPWEWRQWRPAEPDTFENLALFQTIDVPRLNQPGPDRDAFLAFVASNAAGLVARDATFPNATRPLSARLPPSAPAERLSLDGLDAAVLAAYPDLAEQIEIVGCPRCHTANAPFVQTNAEREPSPFYEAELDARLTRLEAQNAGEVVPVPPYGPLQ